ncbi:MMPL family transporter [Streptomyces sp. NPDC088788]|uniref:MMPL family transporter n=1 Tax=Streptomyces sp. NPDC088788 TaxID=3365898 RepID=UPI00381E83B4
MLRTPPKREVTVLVASATTDAAPVLGLRLGEPTAASLASRGGPAATAFERVDDVGLGVGLVHPVEVVTTDTVKVRQALDNVSGVAGTTHPASWARGSQAVVDIWTSDDPSTASGRRAAAAIRTAVEQTGAQAGGGPAQDADFLSAVYGNAPWIVAIIVVVTFLLLAKALHSFWLPVKALILNILSLGAAYGITVLIWQHGLGTEALFSQSSSGAITVWIPIAVFAFLFGLSMDYEVFLLSRIREEHDHGADTDTATVNGVARTGRLVSSAALILFLAFIALSRVPATEAKSSPPPSWPSSAPPTGGRPLYPQKTAATKQRQHLGNQDGYPNPAPCARSQAIRLTSSGGLPFRPVLPLPLPRVNARARVCPLRP